MFNGEIWKPYIYHYDVSNFGRIRNRETSRILKQNKIKTGYYACCVSCGGRDNKMLIKTHIAVAKLFVDNPSGLSEVNHIDGNKCNNRYDNLEWCTPSHNVKHAYDTGLIKKTFGEDNIHSKLSLSDVNHIRKVYKPHDKKFGARALARLYGVHHSTIEAIINNKNWNR